MALFCIRKEKIDKLKEFVKGLDKSNQLQKLIDLPSEKRINSFKKFLTEEEANLLNRDIERAAAEETGSLMRNWVQKNLNADFREKMISNAQKRSIKNFIERKTSPSKRVSEIVPIREVIRMNDTERLTFLKKIMTEKDAIEANDKIVSSFTKSMEDDIASRIEKVKNGEMSLDSFYKYIDKKSADISAINEGLMISPEEVKTMVDLSKKMESHKTKETYDTEKGEWKNKESAEKFSAAKVVYDKYINSIKTPEKGFFEGIREYKGIAKDKWEEDKWTATKDILSDSINTISDTLRASMGSWDVSFMGRQGFNVLRTHPTKWFPASVNSIKNFAKSVAGNSELAMDTILAKAYARDNYANGLYEAAGIMNRFEEEMPETFLSKIPGVERVFKASDVAFNGSAIEMRTSLFDMLVDNFEAGHVEKLKNFKNLKGKEREQALTQIRDIGSIVTASTGRGKMPDSKILKSILWAPKLLKSSWDTLTAHTLGFGLKTSFARKEAFNNWIKSAGSLAGLMIASEATGNEIETNITSPNFGSVKIFGTWVSLGGTEIPLVVLASRLATGISTSGKTGIETDLTEGKYGQQTKADIVINFIRGKANPPVGMLWSMLEGKNIVGEKVTTESQLMSTLPISIQNFIQLYQGKTSGLSVGLDVFGRKATTYMDYQESDWTDKNSKEMKQFIQTKGKDIVENASKEYDKEVSKEISRILDSDVYKKMSNDNKQKVISSIKLKKKQEIFKKYKFQYKQEKNKPLPKF